MSLFVSDLDFDLHCGDVRDVLAALPDESVHCVVTSPPYWGLRDYGTGLWEGGDEGCDHETVSARNGRGGSGSPGKQTEGAFPAEFAASECGKCSARRVDHQLGLEPTPDEYVANMVAVFREVRRVLRRDGTCWLNIGDSYAANRSYQVSDGKHKAHDFRDSNAMSVPDGLKPKDLVGIPWRLAFALQADGWYLRSDIIWSKPNPMPESVTDRPTKAHEYVFLLTRSPRYFFDQEAVRERYSDPGREWWEEPVGNGKLADDQRPRPKGGWGDGGVVTSRPARGPDGRKVTRVAGADGSLQHRDGERWPNGGRNVRSVWEIATEPYPDAHFATFPQALVEPCVLAGTSERGCCPECGAPWERDVIRTTEEATVERRRNVGGRTDGYTTPYPKAPRTTVETMGWFPACDCNLPDPAPCVLLDPFMGSGTTALVARRLGRKSIGIELNADYCALAARRLQQLSLLAI